MEIKKAFYFYGVFPYEFKIVLFVKTADCAASRQHHQRPNERGGPSSTDEYVYSTQYSTRKVFPYVYPISHLTSRSIIHRPAIPARGN
jgi:hypothetical protein